MRARFDALGWKGNRNIIPTGPVGSESLEGLQLEVLGVSPRNVTQVVLKGGSPFQPLSSAKWILCEGLQNTKLLLHNGTSHRCSKTKEGHQAFVFEGPSVRDLFSAAASRFKMFAAFMGRRHFGMGSTNPAMLEHHPSCRPS